VLAKFSRLAASSASPDGAARYRERKYVCWWGGGQKNVSGQSPLKVVLTTPQMQRRALPAKHTESLGVGGEACLVGGQTGPEVLISSVQSRIGRNTQGGEGSTPFAHLCQRRRVCALCTTTLLLCAMHVKILQQ